MNHNQRLIRGGYGTFGSNNTNIPAHLRKEFIEFDGQSYRIIVEKLVGEVIRLENYTNLDILKKLIYICKRDGYFNEIRPFRGWGQMYQEGVIYLNESPMNDASYRHLIFLDQEGRRPSPAQVDNYRFVHELSHAYQDRSINIDNSNLNFRDTDEWAMSMIYLGQDKVNLSEKEFKEFYGDRKISSYAKLYGYCYYLRDKYKNLAEYRFLTTFANQPDYHQYTDITRFALGAIEDSNELVTMYLWNPSYFISYMNYLSGENREYQIYKETDNILTISIEEKNKIIDLVIEYTEEIMSSSIR
jgi:hypothetical protein